ncbi:hypothetical protein BU24DRAFT_417603 [Aaosphaeria arxii CBS 175.79]|uniref:Uncharacterized protein n=1 Tax=Aaosphaeria arxii CBS 175.79 TaxID=1450172 RepID=A0A6A5Y966_9PLEO|nr:uncharacterized protein BU24DRAFT_417603 [Aaosphaeria arxii CBS 175.79]KAF2021958.1 hypothetical protein BU24DRAFT_417603 [Aaosphaeria arxii CBS 175.79]
MGGATWVVWGRFVCFFFLPQGWGGRFLVLGSGVCMQHEDNDGREGVARAFGEGGVVHVVWWDVR